MTETTTNESAALALENVGQAIRKRHRAARRLDAGSEATGHLRFG